MIRFRNLLEGSVLIGFLIEVPHLFYPDHAQDGHDHNDHPVKPIAEKAEQRKRV